MSGEAAEPAPGGAAPPALLTDLYQLTMAAGYLDTGLADRTATFSLFVRDLPPERSFLVAGGLRDVLDGLARFRFGPTELGRLRRLDVLDDATLDHLAGLEPDLTVRAVPEGRLVFPDEPLIEVTGPLLLAQLVETFVLNQVTTQTSLASKAARLRVAAGGRPVLDFSLRRCQGVDGAMKAARAAGMTGLAGTSNVAAATWYDLPASGTMAHSFVQAHRDELTAFRRYAERFGDATVLLIDTYDVGVGLERAITVAGELRERGQHLRGVRIDSGDLADLAASARRRLDVAGFPEVGVLVSGGLDEHQVADLVARAPDAIAGFGVGSSLGVSADAPVLETVYKLVEVDGRPVRKTSTGKETWPGPKQVWRLAGGAGDVLTTAADVSPDVAADALLVTVLDRGRPTEDSPPSRPADAVAAARRRFEADLSALPGEVTRLVDPCRHPVTVSDALRRLTRRTDAQRSGADSGAPASSMSAPSSTSPRSSASSGGSSP